jgi:hypothetical protein
MVVGQRDRCAAHHTDVDVGCTCRDEAVHENVEQLRQLVVGEDHGSNAGQFGPVDPNTVSPKCSWGATSRASGERRDIVDEPLLGDTLWLVHPARDRQAVEVVLDDCGE